VNQRIGQAMHTYGMLADGDRVLVAVSGGIDSLVLVKILQFWQTKAPIAYQLLAVHLDMGFGSDEADQVASRLAALQVDYLIERTDFGRRALAAEVGRSGCFHCARQRRSRLFALAEGMGCNKIAMGHHQEDIIETFFLNLLYGGNLSTMVPRQDFFGGKLAMIRPLAFLTKADIRALGDDFGLSPVANPCPLSTESKRQQIRDLLEKSIYPLDPSTRATIFTALANVRPDYLLKNPAGSNRKRRASQPVETI
jgi:tRNA 2-thiocytidine biosynthesis protein TtcA